MCCGGASCAPVAVLLFDRDRDETVARACRQGHRDRAQANDDAGRDRHGSQQARAGGGPGPATLVTLWAALAEEQAQGQQDADAELQELQQQLQAEFQRKLIPVVQQIVTEKGLHLLLSQADAGIIWADPGVDLTVEVIKRFDAATVAAPAK